MANGDISPAGLIVLILGITGVIAGTVAITMAMRKIPVQIPQKVMGRGRIRHPIGLTSGVDPKSVRFTLGDAHHGVEKRRGKEKQCAENQRQQREPGWIGNAAHAPFVAPASDGRIKQNSSERESDEYENSEVGQQFCAVI